MSKVTLTDLGNGSGLPPGTISVINANNANIEAAIENTISRDGTSPNSMSGDIDMNDNDLLNGGAVHAAELFINGQQVTTASSGVVSVVQEYSTVASLDEQEFVAFPDYIRTAGYSTPGVGGAIYVKVNSEPSHNAKVSITLTGGTVGWYELAEDLPTPYMLGAVGDGITDDTTAFTNLYAFSSTVYWPAGTYLVTYLMVPANSITKTDGYATIIKQKAGQPVGTRVININQSNVIFALEGIKIIGNIATDTNEQNFAVYIYGSLTNVRIGDVYGQDIRGDVVYVGGTTTNPLYNITVGNVYGNNILRNVVAISGGQQVNIGHISGSAVGYLMFDTEPDPGGQKCSQIFVQSVRGHSVGVVGLPVQKTVRIGDVSFGSLDLDPNFTTDSTPAYGFRATVTQDAVLIRNVESVRIGSLKARNFNRSAVFNTFNAGEYGIGDLTIDEIDVEDCIQVDTTYKAVFMVNATRRIKIGGGHTRVTDPTHRNFILDSTGISSTDKSFPVLDVTLETNGIVAFGGRGGRVRVKVHPASGRVLHTARVASTANVTISTLANGSTIDSVVLATNNIVLLKDQTTGSENGLYRVNAAGPATRYTGADASSEFVESYVYASEGTTNIRKYFYCANATAPTVGTTTITYTEDVPVNQYAFSNCRDLTVADSDIILGRAGLDCTNFTIHNTQWRNTVSAWSQSSLADGSLHTYISTTFDGTAYALGPASRTYLRPMNFGGNYIWVDSSNRLRVKSGAPTSDTDGTIVGTQT